MLAWRAVHHRGAVPCAGRGHRRRVVLRAGFCVGDGVGQSGAAAARAPRPARRGHRGHARRGVGGGARAGCRQGPVHVRTSMAHGMAAATRSSAACACVRRLTSRGAGGRLLVRLCMRGRARWRHGRGFVGGLWAAGHGRAWVSGPAWLWRVPRAPPPPSSLADTLTRADYLATVRHRHTLSLLSVAATGVDLGIINYAAVYAPCLVAVEQVGAQPPCPPAARATQSQIGRPHV